MEQRQLFDPAKLNSHQFPPIDIAAQGARQYAAGIGRSWEPPDPQLQVDSQRGFAQNRAFRTGLATPNTPRVQRAYGVAVEHINRQYDHMTRPVEEGGMGLRHEIVTDDPYPDAPSMAADIRDNRRIRTFATASTSDSGAAIPTNQAFSNDVNDRFRAVHDVFGHGATGRGFSRHGEEAAFRSHRAMFPPEAHEALVSETRGQNSYLNFGPEREFPDVGSRMVPMPSWAAKDGPVPKPRVAKKTRPYEQKVLF